MSLEQALNDNTLVMKELIAAIKGMTSVAEVHTVAMGDMSITDTVVRTEVKGTPELTPAAPVQEISYFHDKEHNAVYKFGPTDPLSGVQQRCERIDEAQYTALKAHYAAKLEEVLKHNCKAGKVAATQPTVPADAAPVSEPSTPATVEWAEVVANLMKLAKKPATGQRDVQELLAEFGCAGKMVPAMKDLGKNAEIIASAQRRLGA